MNGIKSGTKSCKNQEKKLRRLYQRTARRWDCRAYVPARIRREHQAARDAARDVRDAN